MTVMPRNHQKVHQVRDNRLGRVFVDEMTGIGDRVECR
jgi:hypothetical protein